MLNELLNSTEIMNYHVAILKSYLDVNPDVKMCVQSLCVTIITGGMRSCCIASPMGRLTYHGWVETPEVKGVDPSDLPLT